MKVENAWQPIETAPRDWSTVLIYQKGAERNDEVGEGYFAPSDYDGDDAWHWGAGNERAEPTDWMPLPAPPQTGDAP